MQEIWSPEWGENTSARILMMVWTGFLLVDLFTTGKQTDNGTYDPTDHIELR